MPTHHHGGNVVNPICLSFPIFWIYLYSLELLFICTYMDSIRQKILKVAAANYFILINDERIDQNKIHQTRSYPLQQFSIFKKGIDTLATWFEKVRSTGWPYIWYHNIYQVGAQLILKMSKHVRKRCKTILYLERQYTLRIRAEIIDFNIIQRSDNLNLKGMNTLNTRFLKL